MRSANGEPAGGERNRDDGGLTAGRQRQRERRRTKRGFFCAFDFLNLLPGGK